jgi:hypothetical protein
MENAISPASITKPSINPVSSVQPAPMGRAIRSSADMITVEPFDKLDQVLAPTRATVAAPDELLGPVGPFVPVERQHSRLLEALKNQQGQAHHVGQPPPPRGPSVQTAASPGGPDAEGLMAELLRSDAVGAGSYGEESLKIARERAAADRDARLSGHLGKLADLVDHESELSTFRAMAMGWEAAMAKVYGASDAAIVKALTPGWARR